MFRLSWRALVAWLWVYTARWEEIGGFKVNIFPTVNDEQAVSVRPRLAAALQQLRDFDARRYRWCQWNMPRIIVRPVRRSHYDMDAGICNIDLAAILTHSPAAIATIIVHEATHARIARAGIPYPPELQDRIENICVAEELAFIRKLPVQSYPGKEKWIAQLTTQLAHGHTLEWHRLWNEWDEERARVLSSRDVQQG